MEFRSLEIQISRSENLPVLPQIASQVMRLADDPDSSPRDMERLIERDSAIAAKVLRVANSSYYGLTQVHSIGRSISILGMNTVRSLVVGIAYQQVISGRPLSKQFNKVEFWRHSVAAATAAKILGKLKMAARADELYSAGLMHDVGFLVMDRFVPDDLDNAVSYAQANALTMHEAERHLYQTDHAEIGALLADKWGLTGPLRNAIRYHHAPLEDTEDPSFTALICLADLLAHQCGYTTKAGVAPTEVDPELLARAELPAEQLEPVKAVVIAEVERAQDALQIRAAA